jgi:hypothetical protein
VDAIMLIRRLVPVALVLFPLVASAAMYKYVDEKGRTVYSQSPPPTGEVEVIKPPPPPATAVEPDQQAAKPAGGEGEAGANDPEQAKRQAESAKIKAESCDRARKALEMYQNAGNRLVKTADGLYERMTEEKRQQGLDAARKSIQEFCN